IDEVQSMVASAVGGENVGETVEGLQRFPINVRYPRELRDSLDNLRAMPLLTERGAQLRLGDVAAVRISDGPPMLRSENARLSSWQAGSGCCGHWAITCRWRPGSASSRWRAWRRNSASSCCCT